MLDIKIQVPYSMNPYMVSNSGSIFNPFPDSSVIIQKKIELELWKNQLYGGIDTIETSELIKFASLRTLNKETTDIVEFALNFEEDVAIMHHGVLQAACFCFPSGWIPKEKIGKSLWEIHSHVADAEKLVQSSKKIAETMAGDRSFYRTVWTVTNNKNLNQLPLNATNWMPSSINDLYFRTEIQTTMPLGNNCSSLFFVRVNMYPLSDVIEKTNLGHKIYESICSMSENILRYKNLVYIKQILDKYYNNV